MALFATSDNLDLHCDVHFGALSFFVCFIVYHDIAAFNQLEIIIRVFDLILSIISFTRGL